MLRRFCLYGFLKNQQYFEPFLILFFLDRGLSFFSIGLLVAFRELTLNLFEIPSGAFADLYGRRGSMILSFVAYIASFLIFGFSHSLPSLFAAMFFFAIGEAYRTGTHKSMIFTWLRIQGRTEERVRVYGYTRSWSKFGSAVSVILGTILVLSTGSYSALFFFSCLPYVLGIINFIGYPKELEGELSSEATMGGVVRHLKEALRETVQKSELRRLVMESMGFEGIFKASKDYLQPILKNAALPLASIFILTTGMGDAQKAALLVGPVYFALHLLSGVASRNAHRIVKGSAGETGAARMLWGWNLLVFSILIPAMVYQAHAVMILGFLALYVLQNLWRPILVGRIDAQCAASRAATILSIESQAKSVSTMIAGPLLGLCVDRVQIFSSTGESFWPVGVLGAAVALGFFLAARRAKA